MPFSKHYGDTEGPLGFPMIDKSAQAVAAILREMPQSKEYEYRKTVIPPRRRNSIPASAAMSPGSPPRPSIGPTRSFSPRAWTIRSSPRTRS